MREALANPQGDAVRSAAAALRSRALRDKETRRRLEALLLDPAESMALREVCAWILGSLDDPFAEAALLKALGASGNAPDWTAVLVRALGETRDPEDTEDFFEVADAPWRISVDPGLGVRICTVLDSDARAAVLKALGDPEAEVRLAALQAVRHSLEAADARAAVALALHQETGTEAQGEAGSALAAWGLAHAGGAGGEVVPLLVQEGLRSDRALLRFRTETALRQLPLSDAVREGVWQAAQTGTELDQRRWALGLLEAHLPQLPATESQRLLQVGVEVAGNPSEHDKLREDAVRILGAFAGSPGVPEALISSVLHDSAWPVRLEAARALGRDRSAPARQALQQAADSDSDERVREAARLALGN